MAAPNRPSFAGPSPGGVAAAMAPPSRWLLRMAGVLSQLSCAVCLLIGTVGVVLVQQSKSGQLGSVLAWLVGAMVGLMVGGLVYRGGPFRMAIAATVDATFGVLLVTLDGELLRKLLSILPPSDVDTIGGGLDLLGFGMIGAGALCLVAIPQGLTFSRWFRTAAETRTAMSTARGFPPPPVPARGAVYIIPADELPSRRRLYMVLGGVAIGVGAGVGVLVSSNRAAPVAPVVSAASSAVKASPPPQAVAPPRAAVAVAPPRAAVAVAPPQAAEPPQTGSAPPQAISTAPRPADGPHNPGELLAAEHKAIASSDPRALGQLFVPDAFGFGVDATEAVDGRDGVVAQIVHDLGDPPAGGFTVSSRSPVIGEDGGHAWIAEELELGGADREPRHFAVSGLAARVDGSWRFVAVHWATPVDDATAERMAMLKTLPAPQPIADRHDGDTTLDHAARDAFASRASFADASSERADAFNYGSGGERARGASIKKVFSKLKATIRPHDGARVVGGSAWDPAQKAAPSIAWVAVNVDFTSKTRAATEVTQTFRVLAVLIKDGGAWKIVQTHWSNGGPIR